MRLIFAILFFCLTVAISSKSVQGAETNILAPPAVLRLANAYVARLPAGQRTRARDDFLRSFFDGFISSKATTSGFSEAERQGFDAGKKYSVSLHPDKLKETMEGFGYVATEANGVWFVGIEWTDFHPNFHPKEVWDLEFLKKLPADVLKDAQTKKGVAVRVTGFLGPGSVSGLRPHYDHTFLAIQISRVEGG